MDYLNNSMVVIYPAVYKLDVSSYTPVIVSQPLPPAPMIYADATIFYKKSYITYEVK